MNEINFEEKLKQGKGYLSKIYSLDRRPITDYPNKLANHIKKKIIEKNINKKNICLLDIGCGRGDMLRSFKDIGFEVNGVDLSEESIKLNELIKIVQFNIENDDVPEELINKYDVIFSKSLIEHLKNPMNFFKNAKKMLRKNGIIIIMTPSWFHHKFGPFYLDFTHVTPFTLQSLRDIAFLNDYKIISVDYFYQLPIIWKFKFVSLISRLVSFLKIPYYPMYENLTILKWTKSINTFLRHSNEVMLIGIFKK